MNEKKYGNPQFDSPDEYLTEEEFDNLKLNKKTVKEIEQVFPGFKEKYAKVYSSGILTQEVAQMIADANVLTEEQIEKDKMKKKWKDKIDSNSLTEKDVNKLTDVILKDKPFEYPDDNKEHDIVNTSSEEHKEFCEELKRQTYTPEQAAKNTAIREQKELSKEIQQQRNQEPQITQQDIPIR